MSVNKVNMDRNVFLGPDWDIWHLGLTPHCGRNRFVHSTFFICYQNVHLQQLDKQLSPALSLEICKWARLGPQRLSAMTLNIWLEFPLQTGSEGSSPAALQHFITLIKTGASTPSELRERALIHTCLLLLGLLLNRTSPSPPYFQTR